MARMTFEFSVPGQDERKSYVGDCDKPRYIAKAFAKAADQGWRLAGTEVYFANRSARTGWQ